MNPGGTVPSPGPLPSGAAAPGVPGKAAIRAEAARLLDAFAAMGAMPVETDVMQPAGPLLDLYGEDIRARAFTILDPGAGPDGGRMLRPDFTVPVVQMHMAGGADPARYAYAGEVFRRQPDAPGRSAEYIQAGYELFDGTDPAAADAEVFALIARQLAPLGLRATVGDIGILRAAVAGLAVGAPRRAALMRHLWRPRRFRALLGRFAGSSPVAPARAALLDAADPMASAGPRIGLRSRAEVAARLDALRADAAEPPVPAEDVARIDAILAVDGSAPEALARLRAIAADLPAIGGAVAAMAARLAALDILGVDVAALRFEGSHGRSTMEYYDGFVFAFSAPGRPDLPPLATGGRYDALTRVLGQGGQIPAVGGVIRPGLTLAVGAGR